MPTAPDFRELTFRQDYFGDRAAWKALADLLQDTFSIDISLQDQFGGPDPTSMPFGYFDREGRCVANFSAFSMPVMVEGRRVSAAGFQSGAVRPEWRGRGLYRDLMRRAFLWSDQQDFELGLLLTDKPALYEPYGFRTVAQHCFVGCLPTSREEPVAGKHLELPADSDFVAAMLLKRTPVSRRFSVVSQTEMFLLNCCFDPNIRLTYLASDDAIIAWKLEAARIRLLDVVAPSIPPLARIIAGLGVQADEVEVCFQPDLLDWQGTAEVYAGYTQLMIRGEAMAHLASPIMLSPMADF